MAREAGKERRDVERRFQRLRAVRALAIADRAQRRHDVADHGRGRGRAAGTAAAQEKAAGIARNDAHDVFGSLRPCEGMIGGHEHGRDVGKGAASMRAAAATRRMRKPSICARAISRLVMLAMPLRRMRGEITASAKPSCTSSASLCAASSPSTSLDGSASA